MKKKVLCTISLMIISALSFSQTIIEVASKPSDSLAKIYTTVDQEAKFPGDPDAWRKYLQKNLKINVPIKNGAPDGTYKVIVKFIVSIDGTIADLYAETNLGYGMEDEVIRVIKKGPKWEPAVRYGRKVNSYKKQPVTFLFAR